MLDEQKRTRQQTVVMAPWTVAQEKKRSVLIPVVSFGSVIAAAAFLLFSAFAPAWFKTSGRTAKTSFTAAETALLAKIAGFDVDAHLSARIISGKIADDFCDFILNGNKIPERIPNATTSFYPFEYQLQVLRQPIDDVIWTSQNPNSIREDSVNVKDISAGRLETYGDANDSYVAAGLALAKTSAKFAELVLDTGQTKLLDLHAKYTTKFSEMLDQRLQSETLDQIRISCSN